MSKGLLYEAGYNLGYAEGLKDGLDVAQRAVEKASRPSAGDSRPSLHRAWCDRCEDWTMCTRRHPLSGQVCPECSTPRSDTAKTGPVGAADLNRALHESTTEAEREAVHGPADTEGVDHLDSLLQQIIAAHPDDSYGGCVTCFKWYTDDSHEAYPCPTVKKARIALALYGASHDKSVDHDWTSWEPVQAGTASDGQQVRICRHDGCEATEYRPADDASVDTTLGYRIAAKLHETIQNTPYLQAIDEWDVGDIFDILKSELPATDGAETDALKAQVLDLIDAVADLGIDTVGMHYPPGSKGPVSEDVRAGVLAARLRAAVSSNETDA